MAQQVHKVPQALLAQMVRRAFREIQGLLVRMVLQVNKVFREIQGLLAHKVIPELLESAPQVRLAQEVVPLDLLAQLALLGLMVLLVHKVFKDQQGHRVFKEIPVRRVQPG